MTQINEIKAVKYVVSWRLNDALYAEVFTSQMLAQIKMIQLEQYGLEPTLHIKD